MIKVSIIIPFYNPGKYFDKCLNSIVNQSLSDIEIILVNDCSTDNSEKIAIEYARKDKRIKLLKNSENKGQGYSRNKGIKEASGKYIGFVDADDFIDAEMYEQLYKNAEILKSDIITCNMKFIKSDNITFCNVDKICHEYYKNYNVYDNPIGFFGEQIIAIVNCLYSREFLQKNNLLFPHMPSEDIYFCLKAKLMANKMAFIPEAFYSYNKLNEQQETRNYHIRKNALENGHLLLIDDIKADKRLHAPFLLRQYLFFCWASEKASQKEKKELVKILKRNCKNFAKKAQVKELEDYSKVYARSIRRYLLPFDLEYLLKNLNKNIEKLFLFIKCL